MHPAESQVPCYKFNVVAVVIFTHLWLVLGWLGSLQSGFLFEDASWESFVEKLGWDLVSECLRGARAHKTPMGVLMGGLR